MSLTTGTRLGPYDIVSALGAGGMGEVYRLVCGQESEMISPVFRRAAPGLVVLAVLGLTGCASAPPPLTEVETTAIIETMTRVSLGLFESRERAACEAAAEQHFSGREPALTWSIVGQGTAGVYTFRTKADLKTACDDTPIPSRFDLEQADAHVLSRDHAYIVLTGLFTREPIDGPPERTRFVMTSVFERVGEDWKVARNHAAGTTVAQ